MRGPMLQEFRVNCYGLATKGSTDENFEEAAWKWVEFGQMEIRQCSCLHFNCSTV